jgi:hypothetical protein
LRNKQNRVAFQKKKEHVVSDLYSRVQ